MQEKKSIPVSLKVVAILFILAGINTAIEIVVSLTHNRVNLNFGILGFLIGPGLLSLRPGWRTCALVFTWFGLIGIPILALLAITVQVSLHFMLFGQVIGNISKGLFLIWTVILFAVALWQYHVLTRPDVKELFQVQTD